MKQEFLNDSIQLFEYYRSLGQKSLDQVSDEMLTWTPDEETNSLSVMVKHLWGNMMSRWTDFLDSDGEKEFRKRDEEFVCSWESRDEIQDKWNEGWDCLFHTLHSLQSDDLEKTIYIRNKGHLVLEAIQRQLGHYSYHVGQMVFMAKIIQKGDWQSLSIPRGKSTEYNAKQFSKPKRKEHFTDDFLDEK